MAFCVDQRFANFPFAYNGKLSVNIDEAIYWKTLESLSHSGDKLLREIPIVLNINKRAGRFCNEEWKQSLKITSTITISASCKEVNKQKYAKRVRKTHDRHHQPKREENGAEVDLINYM